MDAQNSTKQSAWLDFINIIPFDTLPDLLGILWGPNGLWRSGPFFASQGHFWSNAVLIETYACGVSQGQKWSHVEIGKFGFRRSP